MESKQDDTERDTQLELPRGNDSSNRTEEGPPEMDIDPENEVKGIKLLLIHTGICLCTFLIGLVSYHSNNKSRVEVTANFGKDFNLIATAIPVITSEFHSIKDVGWYGSAFYITL